MVGVPGPNFGFSQSPLPPIWPLASEDLAVFKVGRLFSGTKKRYAEQVKKQRKWAVEEEQFACALPWIPKILVATLCEKRYAARRSGNVCANEWGTGQVERVDDARTEASRLWGLKFHQGTVEQDGRALRM